VKKKVHPLSVFCSKVLPEKANLKEKINKYKILKLGKYKTG